MQRVGKKKFSTYRLIISEKTKDTQGSYLEALGTFNPHAKENAFKPNIERIKYWLSKGALVSDTLNNLLISNNIIEGDKKKSVFLTKKRQVKLAEKKKAVTPAPVETPAETPVETSVEQPIAPVETPAETPVETSVEQPIAPVETPAETPTEQV